MIKRIIIVVSHPYREDPQLRKETQTLVDAGFSVHVIAWNRKKIASIPEYTDDVRVENIVFRGAFGVGGYLHGLKTLWFWILVIKRLLGRRKWDAVHCQDLNTLLPGYLAARLVKKIVIYDAHDPYPEMFELSQPKFIIRTLRKIEAFLCRHVDYIITVNQLMARRFQCLTNKPIQVVYNYPKTSLFQPCKGLSRQDGTFVVGRIGSIQPGMGIEETIEAIRNIHNGFRIKLLLVGRVNSSYQDTFNRLIAPIADQIEVVGFVDPEEVAKYYLQMDLSVVLYHPTPIFNYLSPMKLFESMAMGVPVIAADIGEIRKFVENCHCGHVMKDFRSSVLAHEMLKLMNNSNLLREMRNNGIKAIQENLNWEKECEKLVQFYTRVTKI
jgi:glycosyltransferase involved in cell wall biosynthesis